MSRRVRFLLLGAFILAIPLTLIFTQQQLQKSQEEQQQYQQQYQQKLLQEKIDQFKLKKPEKQPENLFGIAAGDSMTRINAAELNRYLDDYKALGAQWVRFDFDWADIQSKGATSYDWVKYDAAVSAANDRGIKILGIIAYTPQWQLPSGCDNNYGCPPKNNADYARFAAAVATRYAPMGVHYWEIWNEPNIGPFTAAAYTSLLKSAYSAIKGADSTAFIVAGGSNDQPTEENKISATDFLTGMYQNGGKGYFDALAHHPYCFSDGFQCVTTNANWSGWSQMQDTQPSLRSIMIANGDQDKKIWVTEFGAPTGGSDHAVDEAGQAQMLADAYTSLSAYPWSGPLFWYTYRDSCTDDGNVECFFGLVRNDYSHRPAYAVYRSLATSGSLSEHTVAPGSTVKQELALGEVLWVSEGAWGRRREEGGA